MVHVTEGSPQFSQKSPTSDLLIAQGAPPKKTSLSCLLLLLLPLFLHRRGGKPETKSLPGQEYWKIYVACFAAQHKETPQAMRSAQFEMEKCRTTVRGYAMHKMS